MKKKVLSIVAVVLVLCCAIGGTLAWLTAKSDVVTNTFAPSDINITLTETPNTDTDNDGKADAWKADIWRPALIKSLATQRYLLRPIVMERLSPRKPSIFPGINS